jgi:hypothetical protein
MIADADTAPPPPPPSPVPTLLLASAVVRAAKMRSRAALYRAERSAKVPAIAPEAGEPSPSLAPLWVGAAERFRMRMGGWKAEAGGTTLERDPVLGDVITS